MPPIQSPAISKTMLPTTEAPPEQTQPESRSRRKLEPVVGPGLDPLQLPEGVNKHKFCWEVIAMFAGIHGVAALAFWPATYSHSGLIVMAVSYYLCSCWGITLCYHRLLTHRGFETPRWFERALTLLAFCNMEGSSVKWIAAHRAHHQHSDHRPDPHSPWVDFFWGHMGWMLVQHPTVEESSVRRYAADLYKDPFHRWMHQHNRWMLVWVAHVALIAGAGWGWGWYASGGEMAAAWWSALSWLVWGVAVRTVLVWHITWAVNSVTHLWGYQNYKTTDQSRNNHLIGLLAWGEGWHNNHHADQRSAKHGHRWWEFDVTYLTIRLLGLFGLAKNVIMPERYDGTEHDIHRKSKD